MYVRKKNYSFRFCLKKNKRERKTTSNLCKNAITVTEFHKIDNNVQQNISLYYTVTDKNKFRKVLSDPSMYCNIICNERVDRFFLSNYDIQTTFKSNHIGHRSFVHRIVNGIGFLIYLPKINKRSKDIYIYMRLFCKKSKRNSVSMYNYKPQFIVKTINFWSESFIEKIILDCPETSLSTDDCQVRNVRNSYSKMLAYSIQCNFRVLRKEKKKTTLIKKSI